MISSSAMELLGQQEKSESKKLDKLRLMNRKSR